MGVEAQDRLREPLSDISWSVVGKDGTRRTLTGLFVEFADCVAALGPDEGISSAIQDADGNLAPPSGPGILTLTFRREPSRYGYSPGAARRLIVHAVPALMHVPMLAVPFVAKLGEPAGARVHIAVSRGCDAAAFGKRIIDRMTLADDLICTNDEHGVMQCDPVCCVADHVDYLDDARRGRIGERWDVFSPSYLTGRHLTPLSDEEAMRLELRLSGLEIEDETGSRTYEYERVAAILGSADPVLLPAILNLGLTGPRALEVCDLLTAAAATPDPLTGRFQNGRVAEAARRYRDCTDESKFGIFLNADPVFRSTTEGLSSAERRLLQLAAWYLVGPPQVGKGTAALGPAQQPGKGQPLARQWLVEGWLPRRGVVGLIGESGHGKSHVVIDLACRIACEPRDPLTGDVEPRRFAKRDISGDSGALYFCSEGYDGVLERAARQLAHISARKPADVTHGLWVQDGILPLSSPTLALSQVRAKIEEMRAAGAPPPALIVVDVFRAAVTGDENNSGDMDAALATAQLIGRVFGVCVAIVHHTKKGEKTARGSGAIKANLDFEAHIEKTGPADAPTYRLTVTKNKNGLEGDTAAWHIRETDAVFVEGEAPSHAQPDDRAVADQGARVLANIVHEHGGVGEGITKKETYELARALRPDLFTKPDGRAWGDRQTRALTAAKRAEWVDERKARLHPGKLQPSESDLAQPPASLDDVTPGASA
jgi:hypothetical protein